MARKLAIVGLAIGLAAIGLAVLANLTVMAGDPVGTGFTYQGYLTNDGSEANGQYDFEFKLYDAATDGNRIGSAVTETDVTVTDGLFTVKLDFGSAAFTGEARWLEIGVKAEDETGYTAISPRTALTPAPYALHAADAWTLNGNAGTTPGTHVLGTTDDVSLTLVVSGSSALRLEPGPDHPFFGPNVIGGFSGNTVNSDVDGATISGGGFGLRSYTNNSVTGDFGTIGGGLGNIAGRKAIVGGGDGNRAKGDFATVGGGSSNLASGNYASVGGGIGNEVSDWYATVGGGQNNTASGEHATVAGGHTNTASGNSASVGGGDENEATTTKATVAGGQHNTASGPAATVAGGSYNLASGNVSTIPGGELAAATLTGQMAYATGSFGVRGDAQTSLYVLRNQTNITETELFLGGIDDERLTVAGDRTLAFDVLIVARDSSGNSAGYHAEGVIENVSGSTSLIGTPTVTTLGEDIEAWDVSITVDDTNDALVIIGTSEGEINIRWVATVRTTEVAW